MDDVLDDTSYVAMSLSVVESSELRRCFVKAGVGREDRAATLSLVTNYATARVISNRGC